MGSIEILLIEQSMGSIEIKSPKSLRISNSPVVNVVNTFLLIIPFVFSESSYKNVRLYPPCINKIPL